MRRESVFTGRVEHGFQDTELIFRQSESEVPGNFQVGVSLWTIVCGSGTQVRSSTKTLYHLLVLPAFTVGSHLELRTVSVTE